MAAPPGPETILYWCLRGGAGESLLALVVGSFVNLSGRDAIDTGVLSSQAAVVNMWLECLPGCVSGIVLRVPCSSVSCVAVLSDSNLAVNFTKAHLWLMHEWAVASNSYFQHSSRVHVFHLRSCVFTTTMRTGDSMCVEPRGKSFFYRASFQNMGVFQACSSDNTVAQTRKLQQ